jgi:hypothetical protein
LVSGADGSILWAASGDGITDRFGYSVSPLGDVNTDGFPDVVVGAVAALISPNRVGLARVLSGVDGSTLVSIHGTKDDGLFGEHVAHAGDTNNDGMPDFIVGARGEE